MYDSLFDWKSLLKLLSCVYTEWYLIFHHVRAPNALFIFLAHLLCILFTILHEHFKSSTGHIPIMNGWLDCNYFRVLICEFIWCSILWKWHKRSWKIISFFLSSTAYVYFGFFEIKASMFAYALQIFFILVE